MPTLSTLPSEILLIILEHVAEKHHLLTLACVNKHLRVLALETLRAARRATARLSVRERWHVREQWRDDSEIGIIDTFELQDLRVSVTGPHACFSALWWAKRHPLEASFVETCDIVVGQAAWHHDWETGDGQFSVNLENASPGFDSTKERARRAQEVIPWRDQYLASRFVDEMRCTSAYWTEYDGLLFWNWDRSINSVPGPHSVGATPTERNVHRMTAETESIIQQSRTADNVDHTLNDSMHKHAYYMLLNPVLPNLTHLTIEWSDFSVTKELSLILWNSCQLTFLTDITLRGEGRTFPLMLWYTVAPLFLRPRMRAITLRQIHFAAVKHDPADREKLWDTLKETCVGTSGIEFFSATNINVLDERSLEILISLPRALRHFVYEPNRTSGVLPMHNPDTGNPIDILISELVQHQGQSLETLELHNVRMDKEELFRNFANPVQLRGPESAGAFRGFVSLRTLRTLPWFLFGMRPLEDDVYWPKHPERGGTIPADQLIARLHELLPENLRELVIMKLEIYIVLGLENHEYTERQLEDLSAWLQPLYEWLSDSLVRNREYFPNLRSVVIEDTGTTFDPWKSELSVHS